MEVRLTGQSLANVNEALKTLLSYMSKEDAKEILNRRDLPPLIREKVEEIYNALVKNNGWKTEKKGISVKWGVEEGRLVFTVKRGKTEAKVKIVESSETRGYITVWGNPPPGVDVSVWGGYSREVDKAILAAVLKTLGIGKKIDDKTVHLTSDDLEKLRRFKSVDEALRKWLGAARSWG